MAAETVRGRLNNLVFSRGGRQLLAIEIDGDFGEVEKIPSRYCDKVQIITALIMAGKYIGGDDFEVWTDSEEGGLYS